MRAFDRILLSSQFMYTTNEQFDDAVEALIAADQASTGGENQERDLRRDGDAARDRGRRLPLRAETQCLGRAGKAAQPPQRC